MMFENLCHAVVFFSEALTAKIYFDLLFERKNKKDFMYISFSILYGLLFLIFNRFGVLVNVLSFFATNAIILILNYRCSVLSSIMHSAYMSFVMTTSEYFIAILMALFFKDYNAYTYNFVALITLSSLSKVVYFWAMIISAKIFRPQKSSESKFYLVFPFCTLPLASTIVSISFIYISSVLKLTFTSACLMLLSVFILLISNILLFIIYNHMQKQNEEKISIQLMLQKEQADKAYYEMLKEQYEQQRILIHDIKSHTQVIHSFLQNKNIDGLEKYLYSFEASPAMKRTVRMCDDTVLNAILLKTADQCSAKGIDFHSDIREHSVDFLNSADITSLFGNLLSNAVEAAEQSAKKQIEISVQFKDEQNITTIMIENSCDEEPHTDENGEYVTKKADKLNHGIGLKSINRIVKKYNGRIKMYYDKPEEQFHTIIVFEK